MSFKKTESKKFFITQIIQHINEIIPNDRNKFFLEDWIFSIENPQISGFFGESTSNVKIPYQNINSFVFRDNMLVVKVESGILEIKEKPSSLFHYILLGAHSFNEHLIFYELLQERILNDKIIDYEFYQLKFNKMEIE